MVRRHTLATTAGAAAASALLVATLSGAEAVPRRAAVEVPAAPRVTDTSITELGAGEKIIVDTDFGQLNDDSQALYMLTQSGAEVLGVTTVTGNTWAQAGTAYALRQLERVERPDVPVHQGLVDPLLGSRQDVLEAEAQLFGTSGYHGAWSGEQPADHTAVTDVYEGSATTPPAEGSAPDFIVEQVKAHPGEVTIVALGPLTNIAVAITNHPEIVPLTKQILYMGGAFDVPANDGSAVSEFNIWFDPEAARIVWKAPWPRQTIVPIDVTDTVKYGKGQYDRIVAGADTTITRHYRAEHGPLFEQDPEALSDLWDVVVPVVLLDPDVVTRSSERYVTVDTTYGPSYGRTLGYAEGNQPAGLRQATVVERIDTVRFDDVLVGLVSAPVRRAGLSVEVTASAGCRAGHAFVDAVARNDDTVPVDLTFTTPLGERSAGNVRPGRTVRKAFSARATTVEAGAVRVTGWGDGRSVEEDASYEAVSC